MDVLCDDWLRLSCSVLDVIGLRLFEKIVVKSLEVFLLSH